MQYKLNLYPEMYYTVPQHYTVLYTGLRAYLYVRTCGRFWSVSDDAQAAAMATPHLFMTVFNGKYEVLQYKFNGHAIKYRYMCFCSTIFFSKIQN